MREVLNSLCNEGRRKRVGGSVGSLKIILHQILCAMSWVQAADSAHRPSSCGKYNRPALRCRTATQCIIFHRAIIFQRTFAKISMRFAKSRQDLPN